MGDTQERPDGLRLSIMNTLAGRPSWWLHGADGRLVAWAGESYVDEQAASDAAESFCRRAAGARYEVYVDASGKFRWRVWSRAVRVAESGEWFDDLAAARDSAQDARGRVPTVRIAA